MIFVQDFGGVGGWGFGRDANVKISLRDDDLGGRVRSCRV